MTRTAKIAAHLLLYAACVRLAPVVTVAATVATGAGPTPMAAASCVIVTPPDADAAELLAAKEVRRYVYLRSGLLPSLVVCDVLPDTGDAIVVANDDDPMIDALRDRVAYTTRPGEHLIKSVMDAGRVVLVITGHDSRATLYAAYRYAERLGVGFDLAGDAIPDAQITLDITGIDEVSRPLFPTRGILPFHDFPAGPDLWNTDDYLTTISQLPKLGMNFIGLHTYPQWSTTEEATTGEAGGVGLPQGPEPTVWIGLPEDVNPDGTVAWSYPAYYAHTRRPHRIWGFANWDTSKFSAGASELFERDAYGSDVMGSSMPSDAQSSNAVFNRVGAMLATAFAHAHALGVRTALGTELPLGLEPSGPEVGRDWVRGMPRRLQTRLEQRGLDPTDPAVVRKVYEGIFTRIMRTHHLDYYWLWAWEVWSRDGVSSRQIQAFKADIKLAHEALREIGAPFQLALAGWVLGTANDPAEFEDALPPTAPFYGLWDEADGFEDLSDERVKWAATWLEEDWGLAQPQLELARIHADVAAAFDKSCDGLIAKHWRTRAVGANTAALAGVLWNRGTTREPPEPSVPADRDAWIHDAYLDWATRQFGSEAAAPIAAVFARLDLAGEDGPGALPKVQGWDSAPGAVVYNEDEDYTLWDEQRYAFIDELAALRTSIVGVGNTDRFDYWLAAFRGLRDMGEYASLRRAFEREAEEQRYQAALDIRRRMARLWEGIIAREVRNVVNASDLGEIMNLDILNWHQLMMLRWDRRLARGLGHPVPYDANPSHEYTGPPRVYVTPARGHVYDDETLHVTIRVVGDPCDVTLWIRSLGADEYMRIAATHRARGVYVASLAPQPDDFEYYVAADTPAGTAVFPVTAPKMSHTVLVLRR